MYFDCAKRGSNTETAFQMAISHMRQQITPNGTSKSNKSAMLLSMFLRYGANPNATMTTIYSEIRGCWNSVWRPIHVAVECLLIDCVSLLLVSGADVFSLLVF